MMFWNEDHAASVGHRIAKKMFTASNSKEFVEYGIVTYVEENTLVVVLGESDEGLLAFKLHFVTVALSGLNDDFVEAGPWTRSIRCRSKEEAMFIAEAMLGEEVAAHQWLNTVEDITEVGKAATKSV
jgi:hypothetical protein